MSLFMASTGLARAFGLARALLIVTLLFGAAALQPASAQQATPLAPAQDQQLLDALRGGSSLAGRITIPDAKAATLIQAKGQDWRATRQGTVTTLGSWLILGIVVLLAVFFFVRGRVRIEAGPANRTIKRFNAFERLVHWVTASSFIILALSGLNLIYGRYLLIPLIGPEAFTAVTMWGKIAHIYLSFPFCLGVVLMLVMWIRYNIPNGVDVEWFKQAGGLVGRGNHPPAGKFNGGQKVVFWTVVLGGTAVAISGYLLMFPFQFTDMAGMQLAQVVHAIVALLLTTAIIAHIYIGSIGMEGAFDAMSTGEVDLNWAREHHSLWVAEAAGEKGRRASAGAD